MSDETGRSWEAEIDLLQQRLNNKQQRITKSLQFTILSATVVLAVPGITDAKKFSFPPLSQLGAILLVISGFAGFAGLALGASPLEVRELSKNSRKLASRYQCRNRLLSGLQMLTFCAGGAGVVLLLGGVVRASGVIKSIFPSVILLLITFLVTGFSTYVGYISSIEIRNRTE